MKKWIYFILLGFKMFSCDDVDSSGIYVFKVAIQNSSSVNLKLDFFLNDSIIKSVDINSGQEFSEEEEFFSSMGKGPSPIYRDFVVGDSAVILFEDGKYLSYTCKIEGEDPACLSNQRNIYSWFTVETKGNVITNTYTITQSDYLNAQ